MGAASAAGGGHNNQNSNQVGCSVAVGYGVVVGAPNGLAIHSQPTPDSQLLGSLPNGSRVLLLCKVHGADVDGNDIWYKMAPRADGPSGWIPARHVLNETFIPFG